MSRYIGLDLSISSTGWALWETGAPKPTLGTWRLADGVDHTDRACIRIQRNLNDLHKVAPFDHVVFEDTLTADKLKGHTTVDTITALVGLKTHVMSFCAALGISWYAVNMKTWRKHFIGSQPRGTTSAEYKRLSLARARALGENPAKHDAAEAYGVLDYHLHRIRVQAPWTTDDVFRQMGGRV